MPRGNSKEIYTYFNKELVEISPNAQAAGHIANSSATSALKICRDKTFLSTKTGYYFSYTPLSKEELDKVEWRDPISKKGLKRMGKGCLKIVRKQAYEVNCKDGLVTYIPRGKTERLKLLRKLVFTLLERRWRTIPSNVAALEETALKELFNSIE